MALVSAANDMQIVPMASQTPVWAGASGGGSVVLRDAVGGPATGGTIGGGGVAIPVMAASGRARRLRGCLHDVVASGAVLVGTMMHDGRPAAEVVERWRGRRRPFEGGGLPRIVGCIWAPEPGPDQVEQEEQLRGARAEGGDRDELVQRDHRLQIVVRECRVAAHVAGQAQVVHRH